MAYNLIQVLQKEGIDYIVAPYEADAQLAFLSINDYVNVVISEDSDLLVFGCKRVLFKFNLDTGFGEEINLSDLGTIKKPYLLNFTQEMFRQVCILGGCDYLPSIEGIGIVTAIKLMNQYRDINKIFKHLKDKKKLPLGYEEGFKKAELTFCHQRIFDHTTKRVIPLSPCSQDIANYPEIGLYLFFFCYFFL